MRSAEGKVITYKHVKALVEELTAPALELKSPSVSHSGLASSGPLQRTPFAPQRAYPWVPPLRPVARL